MPSGKAGELLYASGVCIGYLFPKVTEGRIDPNCFLRFLILYRNNSECRKLRLSFVCYLNHDQVVSFCQRLEVAEVSFVYKIRNEDDHASAFDYIKGEEYGTA